MPLCPGWLGPGGTSTHASTMGPCGGREPSGCWYNGYTGLTAFGCQLSTLSTICQDAHVLALWAASSQ